MKGIMVRPFVGGDEQDVATVHNIAFREWIESLGEEYDYRYIAPEDVSAWVKEERVKRESLWIAVMNDRAVGYAHCRLSEIHAKKDFKELLFVPTNNNMGQSKIAVIPKYRRQGIATALVRKCLKHFERLGANLAAAVAYGDNRAAGDFLQELGFFHRERFYYGPHSDENLWRHDIVYAELDLRRPIEPPQALNSDVTVRTAREEDAKPVARIFRKSAPWTPFGPNASADPILQNYLEGERHTTILVAEYEGKLVGVMDYNSDNNRLGIPGVLPEYRKKGIGYTLFYHLLEHMREKGLPKAIADTGIILANAIEMYKKFKFKIARQQHSWIKILK